jgi:hypothetical protein
VLVRVRINQNQSIQGGLVKYKLIKSYMLQEGVTFALMLIFCRQKFELFVKIRAHLLIVSFRENRALNTKARWKILRSFYCKIL